MRRALLLLVALASGACGQAVAHAAPRPAKPEVPLRLSVYPPIVLLHPNVSVRVTAYVPHPEEFTYLLVGWEYTYPGGGGHSGFQLGDGARRQYVLYLKDVTPGTVWVRGALWADDEEPAFRTEATAEARGGPLAQ